MLTKSLWIMPLVCAALLQGGADEKSKKDLDALQGTWVMHALEINGKEVPPPKLEKTFLIVKGTEYRTKIKEKMPPGLKLVLDATKEPKTMDMILSTPGEADKVHKAIYVLEKDTLKICRPLQADKERPTQFGTWPGTDVFMVTWKKETK